MSCHGLRLIWVDVVPRSVYTLRLRSSDFLRFAQTDRRPDGGALLDAQSVSVGRYRLVLSVEPYFLTLASERRGFKHRGISKAASRRKFGIERRQPRTLTVACKVTQFGVNPSAQRHT